MLQNEKLPSEKEVLRKELEARTTKINFLLNIKNDIIASLGVVSPHLEYEFMAVGLQDVYRDIADKANNIALEIIQDIITKEEKEAQKLSKKIHGV